jgi:hypothetical protein
LGRRAITALKVCPAIIRVGPMAAFLGFFLWVLATIAIASANSKRRKEILDWGIPLAVQIARAQGWVSPHRLRNQLDLTPSDARMVLFEARSRGLLYQAVNGRFYVDNDAVAYPVQIEGEADASPDDTKASAKNYSTGTLLLISAVGFGFLGWFFYALKDDPSPTGATASSSQPVKMEPTPRTFIETVLDRPALVERKVDNDVCCIYEIKYSIDGSYHGKDKDTLREILRHSVDVTKLILDKYDDAQAVTSTAVTTTKDKTGKWKEGVVNSVTFSRQKAKFIDFNKIDVAKVPQVADKYFQNREFSPRKR